MINFSIIIPTKNITDLLERCLKSIPERDDLEIIVIDDNSDPNIVDFNNYPGHDMPNVHIIFSKESKGAGAARNKGLEIAKGKWLIFMDSDDFLEPVANSKFDQYADSDADIIFFLPSSVYSTTLEPADRHMKKVNITRKLKDVPSDLEFFLRYGYTEPWGKFVRKELLMNNNIEFEESLVANDFRFSIETGFYAKKILFDETQLYCVTVREGSLSNNQYDNPNKIMSRLKVHYGVQKFAERNNINIRPFDLFFFHSFVHYPISVPVLKQYCAENRKSYYLQVIRSISNTLVYKMIAKFNRKTVVS